MSTESTGMVVDCSGEEELHAVSKFVVTREFVSAGMACSMQHAQPNAHNNAAPGHTGHCTARFEIC